MPRKKKIKPVINENVVPTEVKIITQEFPIEPVIKPIKLILRNWQSPGDILMLTAAIRDLHKTHPGKFLTDVRTPCGALFENNPYITSIEDNDPEAHVIQCAYPLIHKSNTLPYHFIHGFRKHLAETLKIRIESHAATGDVHISDLEKSWINQVEEITGDSIPFWLISSGGKSDFTAKIWNQQRWQEVVDYFHGRILFVQVGEASHSHPPLEGVINLVGKTDIRQLVRLVYHADGCLSAVSFLMHLAAAVETKSGKPKNRPCVVVAGGRESQTWESYGHHRYLSVNGSLSCCDNGGCWKSRVIPLGDGDSKDTNLCEKPTFSENGVIIPKCLDMIKSVDVIRAIEQYLEWNN